MCSCEGWCHFSDERRYTARRKAHTCLECKGTIAIGTEYCYLVSKWDDGFSNSRLCLGCREDWRRVLDIIYEAEREACWCLGELGARISYCVEMGYLEENDPLAVKWLGDPNEKEGGTWQYTDERQLTLGFPASNLAVP